MKKHFKICLLITFIGSSFLVLADDKQVDCENAASSYEMSYCSRLALKEADEKLEHYIKETQIFYSDSGSMADTIETTYQKWTEYRSSYCSAVGARYAGGSISGTMYYSCMASMSRDFLSGFWDDFVKRSSAEDELTNPYPDMTEDSALTEEYCYELADAHRDLLRKRQNGMTAEQILRYLEKHLEGEDHDEFRRFLVASVFTTETGNTVKEKAEAQDAFYRRTLNNCLSKL